MGNPFEIERGEIAFSNTAAPRLFNCHEMKQSARWRDVHDFGFHSETHRAKAEAQLPERFDAEDAIWFVAPAIEQLTLITADGFHEISFGYLTDSENDSERLNRNVGAEKRAVVNLD